MVKHGERTDILALARELASDFATRATVADREGRLPEEDVWRLRDSGYLASSVPRAYGGYECSLKECVAAQIELAQGSASTAMVAAMQLHVFGHQREVRVWSDDVWERVCRTAAAGALFNFLASEPAMGSPSRGGLPATTATPREDGIGWLVNGRKTWSTGGRHLTHMLVRVNLADQAAVLLVPAGAPGVRWVETWQDALSLRATDSHDVIFEDVRVPPENLFELDAPAHANVWFPMMMASVYLGTAVAAREAVVRFAQERVPTVLGQPIATLPKIQRQIGEVDVALQAARALLLEVAGEWTGAHEQRSEIMPRIAAAKHVVTETANRVTDQALQIAGGSSLTRALPLERYFRDVRAGAMQPPSGDTALEMVGRAALDLQK